MLDLRLYLLQRLTALIMAPLVVGHIVVMVIAVRDGLSAAEILGRTQGSVAWAAFYGTFVLAAAVHAAIGVRVIVSETFKVRGVPLSALAWSVFIGLLAMGGRAVWAVTAGGGG